MRDQNNNESTNDYQIIFDRLNEQQDKVEIIDSIAEKSRAINELREIVLSINNPSVNYSITTGSEISHVSNISLKYPVK